MAHPMADTIQIEYDVLGMGPTLSVRLHSRTDYKRLCAIIRSQITGQNVAPGVRCAELGGAGGASIRFEVDNALKSQDNRSLIESLPNGVIRIHWRNTADDWDDVLACLQCFADGGSGHQYLTREGMDSCVVMVSYRERS